MSAVDDLMENYKKLVPLVDVIGAPGTKPKISDEQLMEVMRVLEEVQNLEADRVEPQDDGEIPLVIVPEIDGRLWDISRRA